MPNVSILNISDVNDIILNGSFSKRVAVCFVNRS